MATPITTENYQNTTSTYVRLKFEERSESLIQELSNRISQLLANVHISVNISKSIVLIPKVDSATGLSNDRLYEILRQVSCEFDSLPATVLGECEIRVNSQNKSHLLLQIYVRQLTSLTSYLAEIFGLQADQMSFFSDTVTLSVGECFPGYEYELASMKLILDDFLRQYSCYLKLTVDALELVEQFPGALSPIQSADRAIFKLEGSKSRIRKPLVRLEDEKGSLNDEFNSILGAMQRDSPFRESEDTNSINRNNRTFTFPTTESELPSSILDSAFAIPRSAENQSLFTFSPSITSPISERPPTGPIPHQITTNQTLSSVPQSYNYLHSPSKSSFSQSASYGQPSFGHASNIGYPSRLSPGKSSAPSDLYPIENREFHSRSIGGMSSQHFTWSDNNSDLIDAPYDIYRSDNTRQRQFSDPIIPNSRSRQYSDPVVPSSYRGNMHPNPGIMPRKPLVHSGTPERIPSIDGSRPPVGNSHYSLPPPTGGYMYDSRVDIPNRERRSISESGALPDGEMIKQFFNAGQGNYSRSVTACPNCMGVIKRNQNICLRCQTPVPLSSSVPQTSDSWTTRGIYSPHQSDSSLGSDLRSDYRSDHSLSISSQHSADNGHLSSSSTLSKDAIVREGDWMCVYCHGHNFATKIACFTCHAARPGFERGIPIGQMEVLGIGRLGGSSAEAKPGDWTCPKCHENVFAKRNRCYRCTTSRPRKLSH